MDGETPITLTASEEQIIRLHAGGRVTLGILAEPQPPKRAGYTIGMNCNRTLCYLDAEGRATPIFRAAFGSQRVFNRCPVGVGNVVQIENGPTALVLNLDVADGPEVTWLITVKELHDALPATGGN